MRRIVAGCAIAAAFLFTVLSTRGAEKTVTPAKAKAAKVASAAAYGNADAINEEELRIYEYFLASDQLEGRNLPSRGYDTAALYVASHLAEWGLKPAGHTSGTKGPLQPYFMPFELVAKTIVAQDSKASVTIPASAGRGGRGGAGQETPQAGPGGRAAASEPRTVNFEYAKDWTFSGGEAGRGGRGPSAPPETVDITGNLVFAGNGYVINKTKTNPYENLDVKGKIIVVAGLPAELAALQAGAGRGRGGAAGQNPTEADSQQPGGAQQAAGGRGAAAQNPLGQNCADYYSPETYAAKNGALAVISVATFQQLTASAGAGRGPSLNGPSYQVARFQRPSACPAAPAITAGIEMTNALFQGEKLTAAQAFYSAGSNARQDSFEMNARKKVSLRIAVRAEPNHAENIAGILEGSDPILKDEYVVISAHLDHLGLSAPLPDGHNVNNGADDNGSGSTALLTIAHAYAQGAAKGLRPKRSVIFLWMGGEEKGLWGSQYFNEFPSIDPAKVVADLNMDMIGRTKNANSVDPNATHFLVNPGEVLLVGPNVSSDDLEKTIETVNNGYQKLTLNHFYDTTAPDATHDNLGPQPNGQRVFYRSDHYNFAKMGIPIAFFTTGLHVDYHRPTDTPEKIDYHEMAQISKTVAAVGWELANQNGRPKLKPNLPEQLVKDMKTAQSQDWGRITPVPPPLPGEPY